MAKLTQTSIPGVYRRHVSGCEGEGRCRCSYAVVWRHRGKQHMETYPTFDLAREAKSKREGGDRRPASKVRLDDYYREWIESYAGRTARGFAESSRALYRRAIDDHVLPRWGGWKLADVEPVDVRTLYRELRDQGRSTSSLRAVRASISAMFATAVEDGVLRSNPVSGVRIPASGEEPQEERAKALTRAELRLLLAAVPEGQQRLMVEFLAVTGLRISEAIGLTWARLDLGGRAHVKVREQFYEGERRRLKSGAARRDVPLGSVMTAKLLAHRRDTYSDEKAPVFPSDTGSPLRRSNLANRVLRPAALAAGLTIERDGERVPWVGFHSLRHTCASMLFERGRNVKQVSEWLGHADPAFTLRTYVHLLDQGLGDGLDFESQVNTRSTPCPDTATNTATPEGQEIAD